MRQVVFVVAVLAAGLCGGSARAEGKKMEQVYEMRVYYAAPGKMKALHERFRAHTCSW